MVASLILNYILMNGQLDIKVIDYKKNSNKSPATEILMDATTPVTVIMSWNTLI